MHEVTRGAIGMQGFQQSLRCLAVRKGFVWLTLWWTKFSTWGKPKQPELSQKTLCADHGLHHRAILVFLSSILATECHQSTLMALQCDVMFSLPALIDWGQNSTQGKGIEAERRLKFSGFRWVWKLDEAPRLPDIWQAVECTRVPTETLHETEFHKAFF